MDYSVSIASRASRDMILDAWRGISVLLVIQYHAFQVRFANALEAQTTAWAHNLPTQWSSGLLSLRHAADEVSIYAGQLGVEFFFVISGFIITSLLAADYRQQGAACLRGFYLRRAFRILPAVWLFLAFTLAMTALGYIETTPMSFVQAFAFLCNTELGKCSWPVGHLWSLSIEEQFYLVWPALLTALLFRNVARAAVVLLAAFLLAAQVPLLVAHQWLNNGLFFACIAAGALYAASPIFQRIMSSLAQAPIVMAAGLLLFLRPLIPLYLPGQYRLFELLTPFLICFVMFGCTRYRMILERHRVVQVLARVGLVSYGLYLWQQPFLARPEFFLRPSILEWAPLFPVFALGSYFLLEKPLIRLGAKLSAHIEETHQPAPEMG
jgi:peptidoglycan/LPS O-acetylase OafA/YrhL